jgi:transposase-like protein
MLMEYIKKIDDETLLRLYLEDEKSISKICRETGIYFSWILTLYIRKTGNL